MKPQIAKFQLFPPEKERLNDRIGHAEYYPPTAARFLAGPEEALDDKVVSEGHTESPFKGVSDEYATYRLRTADSNLTELRSNALQSIREIEWKRADLFTTGTPKARFIHKGQGYPLQKAIPKIDTWMSRLASSEPLHKLTDQVPHGPKNEGLLRTLITNQISMSRATWYIKIAYLNKQTKPATNQSRDFGWTDVLITFLLDTIKRIASFSDSTITPATQLAENTYSYHLISFIYIIRLTVWQYCEGLLAIDKIAEKLCKAVQEMSKPQELSLILYSALSFLPDLLPCPERHPYLYLPSSSSSSSSQIYINSLFKSASTCVEKMTSLYANAGHPIPHSLSGLCDYILHYLPSCLPSYNDSKLRQLLADCDGERETTEKDSVLCYSSSTLEPDEPQQLFNLSIMRYTILTALDGSIHKDLQSVYTTIFDEQMLKNTGIEVITLFLCEWAVNASSNFSLPYRSYIVTNLLSSYWRNVYQDPVAISPSHDALYSFLQDYVPQSTGDVSSVSYLFGEFILRKLFSHNQYLKDLIRYGITDQIRSRLNALIPISPMISISNNTIPSPLHDAKAEFTVQREMGVPFSSSISPHFYYVQYFPVFNQQNSLFQHEINQRRALLRSLGVQDDSYDIVSHVQRQVISDLISYRNNWADRFDDCVQSSHPLTSILVSSSRFVQVAISEWLICVLNACTLITSNPLQSVSINMPKDIPLDYIPEMFIPLLSQLSQFQVVYLLLILNSCAIDEAFIQLSLHLLECTPPCFTTASITIDNNCSILCAHILNTVFQRDHLLLLASARLTMELSKKISVASSLSQMFSSYLSITQYKMGDSPSLPDSFSRDIVSSSYNKLKSKLHVFVDTCSNTYLCQLARQLIECDLVTFAAGVTSLLGESKMTLDENAWSEFISVLQAPLMVVQAESPGYSLLLSNYMSSSLLSLSSSILSRSTERFSWENSLRSYLDSCSSLVPPSYYLNHIITPVINMVIQKLTMVESDINASFVLHFTCRLISFLSTSSLQMESSLPKHAREFACAIVSLHLESYSSSSFQSSCNSLLQSWRSLHCCPWLQSILKSEVHSLLPLLHNYQRTKPFIPLYHVSYYSLLSPLLSLSFADLRSEVEGYLLSTDSASVLDSSIISGLLSVNFSRMTSWNLLPTSFLIYSILKSSSDTSTLLAANYLRSFLRQSHSTVKTVESPSLSCNQSNVCGYVTLLLYLEEQQRLNEGEDISIILTIHDGMLGLLANDSLFLGDIDIESVLNQITLCTDNISFSDDLVTTMLWCHLLLSLLPSAAPPIALRWCFVVHNNMLTLLDYLTSSREIDTLSSQRIRRLFANITLRLRLIDLLVPTYLSDSQASNLSSLCACLSRLLSCSVIQGSFCNGVISHDLFSQILRILSNFSVNEVVVDVVKQVYNDSVFSSVCRSYVLRYLPYLNVSSSNNTIALTAREGVREMLCWTLLEDYKEGPLSPSIFSAEKLEKRELTYESLAFSQPPRKQQRV